MIDPVRTGPVNRVTPSPNGSPVAKAAPLAEPMARSIATRGLVAGGHIPRLMELAADLAQLGPPIDYAKIAQVRRAIADGGYRIDADALAMAIMNYPPEQ